MLYASKPWPIKVEGVKVPEGNEMRTLRYIQRTCLERRILI